MSWLPVDENTPKNKNVLVVSEKYPEVHEARLYEMRDGGAEWITYSVNGAIKDNPTHWMPMPPSPTESREEDFWIVLAQGRGDARYQLHAGALDRQGAIDLAFSVSHSFRASECQARIINLANSLYLTLDEGDLISAKDGRGQPIKINSTRAR